MNISSIRLLFTFTRYKEKKERRKTR